jgi:hypothetical protein
MASELWLKYAWLDDEPNDDVMAGCLGVVIGVDEATVRRQLAVDEASRLKATVHEAWQISESCFGNDLVQVSSIDEAVVTFEPNGWHGVEPEVAVALSKRADDEAATAALLATGGQGNIRTTTLRAFNIDEMRRVIEKTP